VAHALCRKRNHVRDMPKAAATRELLASPQDVWAFLAEPHHFPDWWPGVAGVQPDRRGLAPGARWQLRTGNRPSLLRRPDATGTMVILRVEPPRLLAWQLTGDRIDAELTLEETGEDRTRATLVVEAPWLVGLPRAMPRKALSRLYALCQTGAEI
jgi:uncharacterized protein YndB with AHSA1/START domain